MKILVKWLCMFVVATTVIGGEAQAQPEATPRELRLTDFSRMSREEGEGISFVDREGTVREGVLIAASADAITMRFAGGEQVFAKSAIARVDRLRDGTGDGALKGAAFGVVLGFLYLGAGAGGDYFVGSVVAYSSIGWLIDAMNTNRQPIYRAPSPAPALKVSIRF